MSSALYEKSKLLEEKLIGNFILSLMLQEVSYQKSFIFFFESQQNPKTNTCMRYFM